MGEVSADDTNPIFDLDVEDDGLPKRVTFGFHQGNLTQRLEIAPWIPIGAYAAIKGAAAQSQAAFNAAVNATGWAPFYTYWLTTANARKCFRYAVHQTPIPLPMSAIVLPP